MTNIKSASSWRRLLCTALLSLGTAAIAAPRTELACEVTYGGETNRVVVVPAQAAFDVPPQQIGTYFLFRAVREAGADSVRVDVYSDREPVPVPIQQAEFRLPARPGVTPAPGFSGWQRVHEPVRDGELQYWCGELPRQRPQRPVRLVLAGDVMLDDGPGRTVAAGGDPLAPFASWLAAADYRIANLECPVATVGSALDNKIYTFRADPQVLRVLQGRFDAVALSNNHSGDYGPAALLQTMDLLTQAGIRHFGAGRHARQAHRPLWIERDGLRIALLGYNEFKPRSFEAGPDWAGVAWSDDHQVRRAIRDARAAGADVVIPFMHWGWEREPQPDARQQTLARLMIDAGADMVVGGHPHVTQGASLYKGRPIVWSLGNFVFDGFERLPAGRIGWLLRLEVDERGIVRWDTVQAHMDNAGTPHPEPQTATPCGRRGQTAINLCQPEPWTAVR